MAAIGTGEIVHAASRCERITVIFVNNAVFGATGGQQAPTTLLGQKTTSFPGGRDPPTGGYPLKMSEMLALVSPESYIVRVSIHDVKHINQAAKATRRAFEVQMNNEGFSMVEISFHVPHPVEGGAGGRPEMDRGKDDPLLPAGELRNDKELIFSPQRAQRSQRIISRIRKSRIEMQKLNSSFGMIS